MSVYYLLLLLQHEEAMRPVRLRNMSEGVIIIIIIIIIIIYCNWVFTRWP